MENQNWLILGGCGYIGRNLVKHLLDLGITHITVADKKLPVLANMHPSLESLYEQVEFVQSDISRTPEKVFTKEFDYIVNLAGETRSALPENTYMSNSVGVIQASLPFIGSAKWIEVSTCKVYFSSKSPLTETAATTPWTIEGRWRLEAEKLLEGANTLILRPALVYGNGDVAFVTARAVLGAVYRRLKKKMKILWGKDLRVSSVHVIDVCRAIVELRDVTGLFNLADTGNTTQDHVNKIVAGLTGCKYGYYSRTISSLASLQTIAEAANDLHVPPWSQICMEQGVDSPITPFVEEENLDGSHTSVDGTQVTRTGFQYLHPRMSVDEVRSSLLFLIEGRIIPNILA